MTDLELNTDREKCSRTDPMFYKNHGSRILLNLAESLEMANSTAENIEARSLALALRNLLIG